MHASDSLGPSDPPNLAEFLAGEGPDLLKPPAGFTRAWQDWADSTSLFEPELLGAPEPRCRYRIAGQDQPVINFASYNYLGLAQHPEVIAAIQEAVGRYGSGACGSPMLSGMTDLHRELEQRLSAFLGREATLLFNSGFGGALGCISGLLRRGDVAVVDGKAHLSLRDGAQLARARIEVVPHNDLAAFETALQRHAGRRCLVVTEGLYSMDGDVPALPGLCALAEAHGASVLVDEAHSILTSGANGRGACEAQDVEARVGLLFGTFSKAFAGLGGFVSGPAETIDYLRCYAHSYTFSCALPPATVAGLLGALEVSIREPQRRERLAENAAYFRAALLRRGLDLGGAKDHVIPLIVGSDRRGLFETHHALLQRGVFMAPIDYPAVSADRVRFRASMTSEHTRADLDEALNVIEDVMVRGRRPA